MIWTTGPGGVHRDSSDQYPGFESNSGFVTQYHYKTGVGGSAGH